MMDAPFTTKGINWENVYTSSRGSKGFACTNTNGTAALCLGRFILVPHDTLFNYYMHINNYKEYFSNIYQHQFSSMISNEDNLNKFLRNIYKENKNNNYQEIGEEIGHYEFLSGTNYWRCYEVISYLKRFIIAVCSDYVVRKIDPPYKLVNSCYNISVIQACLTEIVTPLVEGWYHYNENIPDKVKLKDIYNMYNQETSDICNILLQSHSDEVQKGKIVTAILDRLPIDTIVKGIKSDKTAHDTVQLYRRVICDRLKSGNQDLTINENTIYNRLICHLTARFVMNWFTSCFCLRILFGNRQIIMRTLEYRKAFLQYLSVRKNNKNTAFSHPSIRMYNLDGVHISQDNLVKLAENIGGAVGFEKTLFPDYDHKYKEILPLMYYWCSIYSAVFFNKNPMQDLDFAVRMNPSLIDDEDYLFNWVDSVLKMLRNRKSNMQEQFHSDIRCLYNDINSKKYSTSIYNYLETQFIHGG